MALSSELEQLWYAVVYWYSDLPHGEMRAQRASDIHRRGSVAPLVLGREQHPRNGCARWISEAVDSSLLGARFAG